MYIEIKKDFEKYALSKFTKFFAFYKSNKRGTLTCYCTHCQKTHVLKNNETFEPKLQTNTCHPYYLKPTNYCPNCSAEIEYKSAAYEQITIKRVEQSNLAFFEKTKDGLSLKVVRVLADYSDPTKSLKRKPKLRFDNFMTYNFTQKNATLSRDEFHNMGGRSKFNDGMRVMRKIESYEDFYIYGKSLDEIVNSDLSSYNNYIMQYSRRCNNSFLGEDCALLLAKTIKYPIMKRLFNLGFYSLIKEKVNNESDLRFVNFRGKNLNRALKVELSQLQKFNIEKLKDRDIGCIFKMIQEKVTLSDVGLEFYDSYQRCKILELTKALSTNKIIKYLTKQKCSTAHYYDYIMECKELGFNLNNIETLTPKYFAAAHDRTMTATRALRAERNAAEEQRRAIIKRKEEIDTAEGFLSATKKWIKYNYSDETFSIKVIESVAELIRESKIFNNCSHGHAKRIAEGCSVIFLITKKSEPGSPFYMMELCPNTLRIVQCHAPKIKGSYVQPNATDDVQKFMDKWLKITKILIEKEKRLKQKTNEKVNQNNDSNTKQLCLITATA